QVNSFSSCFITGSAADSTPPVVTQVTPPDGSTDVPLNSLISVQVSKPLSQFAFPTTAGGSVLPLSQGPGPQGGPGALDLGFFPAGTSITIKAGGHGHVANNHFHTNPDGPLFAAAGSPWPYANANATNYPTKDGGDGVNHFAGGGANIDQNGN